MSGPQNLLGYSTSSAMVKLLCVLFVCVSSSAAFVSPNYGLSTIGVGRFSPAVSRANARKEAVFMAAKSKKNKKSAPNFKGFGAVPEKLIDRVPRPEEPCVCQSGETYGACCKPFHDREDWPSSPLALARSRYSAYAYRLPNWIIDSTHKSNPDWKSHRSKWERELLGFCDGFTFEALEILEEADGEDESEKFLEFIARLRAANAPSDAPTGVKATLRRVKMHGASDYASADFRERSRFLKEDGKWFYVSGDVDFDPEVTLERANPLAAKKAAAEEEGEAKKADE
mmetsp:Transcript_39353/g.93093  ORF Transcript_39353/g.93093 Transcript_39353/m.93093 type:complete len:285 (-) Transcript_39353:193-1047(-)